MDNITISLSDLLWFAGAICTLAAAWKIVVNNPVSRHEKQIDELEKRAKEQGETEKMLLNSNMAIIEHLITGNGIDNMKKIRDEMHEYLIQK